MIKQFILKTVILLLVIALLTPILTIGLYIFQGNDETWQHLLDTVLLDYIKNSLILAVGVGFLSCLLGISTAWLTSTYSFFGHKVLPTLLMLPMAMPAYIIAFTYSGMLDSGGTVQHYFREWTGLAYGEYWFPDIRNIWGAMVMLSLVLYPYVFLMVRASFLTQSAHAIQVGESLGLNARQRFFRIALPLSRPAIIAGSALVIMETLADYGTVQYFGVNTFTTGIFRTWYGLNDLTSAAKLSAMLLFAIMVVFGLEAYSRRKVKYHGSTKSNAFIQKKTVSKSKQVLLFTWCLIPALLGFIIPTLQLGIWALGEMGTIDAEFMTLCWNSFYLALITSIVCVGFAIILYSFKRFNQSGQTTSYKKQKSRLNYLLNANFFQNSFKLINLGYAIPGIVVAIGVLIPAGLLNQAINKLSQQLTNESVGLLFIGSIGLLVFAYMVRFMAVALGNIESGFSKISLHIDEAAQSLNAKFFTVAFKIHFPIIYKAVLTAVLIIFVDILKELPTTLVLRPFNFNTLAVKAFELASDEFLQEAALPSIFIVITGLIPVILLNRSISK